MTTIEKEQLANDADQMLRDRFDPTYEILYHPELDSFVMAAPKDESEGGDPKQPTAVLVGHADEFTDAEMLFNRAGMFTCVVDDIADEIAKEESDELVG